MKPWTEQFAHKARQIQVTPNEQTWQKLHARLNQRHDAVQRRLRWWQFVAAASLFVLGIIALRAYVAEPDGVQVVGELEPTHENETVYINARPSMTLSAIDPQATLLPNTDPQRQEKFARIMADLEERPADVRPVDIALGHYQLESGNLFGHDFKGTLQLTGQTSFNLQVRYDGQNCFFLRIPGQANLFVQQAPSSGLLILEVLSSQHLVLKWYDELQSRFLEGKFRLHGSL